MPVETWTLLPCVPKVAARDAARAEAEGWTGVLLADSQNLAAELVVELALCVAATEKILVSPGVTNPVTRHPAVLAGALATLQAESGGRAVAEIGRGDSALAHLGLAPMKLGPFRRYVDALRTYLRGGDVAFDPAFAPAGIASVGSLGLGHTPEASSLRWLRPGQPIVPVGIAATGPRVIEMAAVAADGVSLSVGADPDRVGWAVEQARKARIGADLDPDDLRLAAFVNVAVHADIEIAARLTAGKLASFSRFSVMHGTGPEGSSTADRAALEELRQTYDMTEHGRAEARHAEALSLDFARRNAVVGAPQACLERLWTLRELGVTRFFLTEEFSRTGVSGEAHDSLVRDVLPEVNSWS
jgi:5,10-methylenetetrahydromethanopterin reductase